MIESLIGAVVTYGINKGAEAAIKELSAKATEAESKKPQEKKPEITGLASLADIRPKSQNQAAPLTVALLSIAGCGRGVQAWLQKGAPADAGVEADGADIHFPPDAADAADDGAVAADDAQGDAAELLDLKPDQDAVFDADQLPPIDVDQVGDVDVDQPGDVDQVGDVDTDQVSDADGDVFQPDEWVSEMPDGDIAEPPADQADLADQADGADLADQADGADLADQADGVDTADQADGIDTADQADMADANITPDQADGVDIADQADGVDTTPGVCLNAPTVQVTYPAEGEEIAPNDSANPETVTCEATNLDPGDVITGCDFVFKNASGTAVHSPLPQAECSYQIPVGALENGVSHSVEVTCYDSCPNPSPVEIRNFNTLEAACYNAPSPFGLITPDPAAGPFVVAFDEQVDYECDTTSDPYNPPETMTYIFEFVDPDTGGVVHSLDNGNNTALTFTLNDAPVGTFENNKQFELRVRAVDECGMATVSFDVWTFLTEPECLDQPPIVETDFTTGELDGVNNTTFPGSIILDDDCNIIGWKASSGLMPTEADLDLSLNMPSGGTVQLTTDPVTGDAALLTDSLTSDINDVLRYEKEPLNDISNSGWSLRVVGRPVNNFQFEPGLAAFGWDLADGSRRVRVDFRNDVEDGNNGRIIETISGLEHAMDVTSFPSEIIMRGSGNDFFIDVDGTQVIDGTGAMTFGVGITRFWLNDLSGNPDSRGYWNELCLHGGSTEIPFKSSGIYEQIFNFGPTGGRLKSVTHTGEEPAETSVTYEFRTGGTSIPDGTWSDYQAWTGTEMPIDQYVQLKWNLSTLLPNSATPKVDETTLPYCAYQF